MTFKDYPQDFRQWFSNLLGDYISPLLISSSFQNKYLEFYRNLPELSQALKINFKPNDKFDGFYFYFEFGFFKLSFWKVLIGESNFWEKYIGYPKVQNCFLTFDTRKLVLENGLYFIKQEDLTHKTSEKIAFYLKDYILPIFNHSQHMLELRQTLEKRSDIFYFDPQFPYVESVFYDFIGDKSKAENILMKHFIELREIPFHKYQIEEVSKRLKVNLQQNFG